MQISVAMCTFNGERYLPAQLASIAAQTMPPCELVVCDDGSADRTCALIEAFAATVPFPVRLHRNPRNLRSTKNFEQAIRLCAGEAIALCDQDDVWEAEKLAVLGAVLADNPEAAGVFSNAFLIDGEGTRTESSLWDLVHFGPREKRSFAAEALPFLLRRPLVTGAAFVFRSRFLPEVTPIPPEWVHDAWIAMVLASVSKLVPVEQKLFSYRLHASQQLGLKDVPALVTFERTHADRIALYRADGEKLRQGAEKLKALGVGGPALRYARRKSDYLCKRAALLEEGRLQRLLKGLSLLPGYTRFTWGPVSYLRDCLHGAGEPA